MIASSAFQLGWYRRLGTALPACLHAGRWLAMVGSLALVSLGLLGTGCDRFGGACGEDGASHGEGAQDGSAPAAVASQNDTHRPNTIQQKSKLRGEPEYLPQAARFLLKKRMVRHAIYAQDLMLATVTLDYTGAQAAAQSLIAEPQLRRAEPHAQGDANSLNALLPKELYDYQDSLKAASRQVAQAAANQDAAALAAAFSTLSQSCVTCHATYLGKDAGAQQRDQANSR